MSKVEEAVERIKAEIEISGPHALIAVCKIEDLRTILDALSEMRTVVGWCQRRLDPRQQKFVDELLAGKFSSLTLEDDCDR
jgi:hypothetical protein